ncbi:MAG TPA: helix-turn-helix domain-containing protein [Dehalococcoidia bacterium]|nr:helix-turn-helix domain-containing protein [Dehalococcoidia bacterium]
MATSYDSDLVTVAEAARILRVSAVTIQRWLRQGRLSAHHIGPRAVRIRRIDLAQVIAPYDQRTTAAKPASDSLTTTLAPLDDEEIAAQQAALAASAELLAQQAARRGGKPFDESWPLIRVARAARSRQQA